MFMNKVFQRNSSITIDELSVCILQWTYDFEERLLGTTPTVPVISSHISICGLSSDAMEELCMRFTPKMRHHVEEGFVAWQEPDENGNEGGKNISVSVIKMTKNVTKLLSHLVQKEFKIVTSTVDSSAFSGYVTKTYSWTLQK